jgi:plastocyanin
MKSRTLLAAVMVLGILAAPIAWAQNALDVPLTIENNRFSPEDVKVKAGTPFVLVIANKDAGAEEFESKDLRIEKIIPGGKTVRLKMPPLRPGTYRFFGEYHEKTAQGRIVAE